MTVGNVGVIMVDVVEFMDEVVLLSVVLDDVEDVIDADEVVEVADVVDVDDVLVELESGGKQCPFPSGLPLRHRQAVEHSSPVSPFVVPLSHSSPSLDCHLPSPHPAGEAPRARI